MASKEKKKSKPKACSCKGARAGRPHDRADCEVLRSVLLEAQQIEAQIAEDHELRRRGQQG
jgi:hypothetical protein